jgi:uncharacterized protein YkwD
MRATRNPWFPRSLVVLSVGAAVGLGAAGSVARAKDPSIATDSGASLSATEAAVVARTNDARAKRGLGPLSADASLMNGARRQASWMARNSNLSHGQGATENIAMGQSSASEAVADWMRSDGHRANILGSHSRIGVAMARAADGTVYWCQQFR